MNGRDMLLVLAHLFRKKGDKVTVDEAIDFLSFRCRYGAPTDVRKMLSMALKNEMISKDGDRIAAQFLFDKQNLPLNLSSALQDKVRFQEDIQPMF
jgi:hypothetical protein